MSLGFHKTLQYICNVYRLVSCPFESEITIWTQILLITISETKFGLCYLHLSHREIKIHPFQVWKSVIGMIFILLFFLYCVLFYFYFILYFILFFPSQKSHKYLLIYLLVHLFVYLFIYCSKSLIVKNHDIIVIWDVGTLYSLLCMIYLWTSFQIKKNVMQN